MGILRCVGNLIENFNGSNECGDTDKC